MKYKAAFAGCIACMLTAGAASAATMGSPVVRNVTYGGVQNSNQNSVIYADDAPWQGSFYIGARGALNLINFSNKYSLKIGGDTASDSYSFGQQLGFDVSAGYDFAQKWRAELNYGYTGEFKDSDNLATFSLSAQYLMANVLYTLKDWGTTSIYVGPGVGAAILKSRISSGVYLSDNKDTQTKTTYAAQLMFGLEEAITPRFAINLQYRLMYNGGMTHESMVAPYIDPITGANIVGDTEVDKISGILTNSFMLGARFKF